MRFIENGPSIPDDLLLALDEGRVLFFCGAGVSRAKANLADFYELTGLVLDKLRVPTDHSTRKVLKVAKKIGACTGASGLISVDRIFGLLEGEFNVRDVQEAVANALKPNEKVDLSAHRIMLDLATTSEGKIRLVTTNFDRLFEECLEAPTIWYSSHLPDPSRTNEFHGIIHLHGIVDPNYERAEGEGLILSSSAFGRAYLAEGWATQFIREILNQYVVVFIGYGADDPPIQYLLEALNKIHGPLANIYAFQEGAEQEAIGKWLHRGVKAIAYDNKDDHSALWNTLAEWAKRAQSPEFWYQSVIDLAKKGPEVLRPFERGQVAHIVSTSEGVRLFAEGDQVPQADWLCVFDPERRYTLPGEDWDTYSRGKFIDPFALYGLDSDEIPPPIQPDEHNGKREIPATAWNAFAANKRDQDYSQNQQLQSFRGHWAINPIGLPPRLSQLGIWLSKVADQPAAVWWVAKQSALHPDIQLQIQREIIYGSKTVESEIRRAWHYLFEAWSHQENHHQVRLDWHQLRIIIDRDGWSNQCLREYSRLKLPYLKVEHGLGRNRTPPQQGENPSLRLKVKYPERGEDIQIADEWLPACIRELRKNLEYAQQLEYEISRRSCNAIGPIIPENDPQVDRHGRTVGLYGCVIHFSKSFERLMELDVTAARKEFSLWPANNQDVFDRLRIWAAGMPELVTDQCLVSILLELGDEIFWDSYSRRDLLLVLARRWQQLALDSRVALEARLLAGLARWDTESEQDFLERNAYVTLSNLHWLAKQGCSFTFDLAAETERLNQHAPNWTQNQINTAVESIGSRGGIVSYNEDYSPLLSEGLSTILSKSLELSGRSEDFLIENTPFAGLCKAKPARAFSVLTHAAKNAEFPKWAWERRFLYSPARDNDKPKFSAFIAAKIASYAPEDLIEIIYPISPWLKKIAKILATEFYPIYSRTVDKLIATIQCRPSASGSSVVRGNKSVDWITEAINSPVGHIVEILMYDLELKDLKENTSLPSRWVSLIDSLLALPDDLRRYALVLLAKNLAWFHYIDPNWTEHNLLMAFSSENPEDQQSVWSGFLWAGHTPAQPLYMRLKSQMLNFAKNGDLFRQELEKPLVGIILAGWGSIHEKSGERCVSNDELHNLILHCDDESRCQLIWHLESWGNEDKNWALLFSQLFKDVWPRQKMAKTPRVSLALFELLFSSIERFEQLADLILPLLTTIKLDYLDRSSIENILDKHPDLSLEIFYKVFSEIAPIDLPYALDQALDRITDANKQLRADPRWLQLKRKSNDR